MTILIDETPIECKEGELLIEVMIKNSIEIPHFCYHSDLGADGNCRMCMVEIKGAKRPQIACDTLTSEGLEVITKSKNITDVKRSILELELLNHPVDCPICDQAGECKLQDYYMDYGLYESRLDTPKTKKGKHIDLGSNVVLDQERCVLCTRCVRFTTKVTKTAELGVIGRGDSARISTAPNKKLSNDYAMNVVELCPVGALTSKDFRFKQRVWFLESASSICHGCARGCNIFIDYNETKYASEKIHRFRARYNKDINKSFLCDYGRLSYKKLNEKSTLISSNIKDFKELLKTDEKIVALASASLSLEQLTHIKNFSKHFNIELFSLPYIDESFQDKWLKCSDMSANFNGVKALHINHDEKKFLHSLEMADVVINFDHERLKNEEFKDKKIVQITSSTCSGYYELIYTISDYAHESGTLINCDGIEQKFYSTKYHQDRLRLSELLGELL